MGLLFVMSPRGGGFDSLTQAGLQPHDLGPTKLLQLELLRVETSTDLTNRLRVTEDCAVIWALSSNASMAALEQLMAVVRESEKGDRAQLDQLANRVEKLLTRCASMRPRLAQWISANMDGEGPNN